MDTLFCTKFVMEKGIKVIHYIWLTQSSELTTMYLGERIVSERHSILCFYATNVAINMKTWQISELDEFCCEYENVANFKMTQMCRFIHTFFFCFPIFILLF